MWMGLFFSLMLFLGSQAWNWQAISARPEMNEYMGSSFQTADGRICVVFEDIPDFEQAAARLWRTCQTVEGDFADPALLFSNEALELTSVQNARVIRWQERDYVYFNAYDRRREVGLWGRAEISESTVGPIEWLSSPIPLQHQERAWIYPKVLGHGEMLLTYEARHPTTHENQLHFSLSSDGIHFSKDRIFQSQAQMGRFEEFGDGTWAFVFQVGFGGQMTAFIRLSHDRGETLTAPIPISDQSNIHDPVFLKRLDGDLDVYYIVWHGDGFGVHRRHVRSDGSFGAEETLSHDSLNLQKPSPLRLSDNSLFLSAGRVKMVQDGRATSDLVGIRIPTDSP